MKVALITGITGQDGAYLSAFLLDKGYRVVGIVRSINDTNRYRLDYLKVTPHVELVACDLMDLSQCLKVLNLYQPDEVYNLAAQSSVSLSFDQPIGTMSFNIISVINVLEAIKITNPKIKYYQASSSEMFGKIEQKPATEYTFLHPLSPYAISKATSHWTTTNYRESYNLFACCGILFNHDSYLRPPSFFVKKVIHSAIKIKYQQLNQLTLGNLNLKRDFGYAKEYIKAMWLIMQKEQPDDFLICSGASVKLLDIVHHVFDRLNIDKNKIVIDNRFIRPNEIIDIYGDNTKAKNELGWNYNLSFFDVLDILIEEELLNFHKND